MVPWLILFDIISDKPEIFIDVYEEDTCFNKDTSLKTDQHNDETQVVVKLGTTISLVCSVTSSPPPTSMDFRTENDELVAQWNKPFTQTIQGFTYRNCPSVFLDETRWKITFQSDLKKLQTVTCSASNNDGSGSMKIRVRVGDQS